VTSQSVSKYAGDWGFFMSYFSGGISILVLAIGSTNPGVLAFFIDKFSQVFPDYRDRVLRHEAAHFLIGYLLGVPVLGYDLAIGREHTDFAEAKLQKRLFQSNLSTQDIDQLAVVAMAGVAAEAMEFDDVCFQRAVCHTATLSAEAKCNLKKHSCIVCTLWSTLWRLAKSVLPV
jgi:hypothetical protein